MEIHLDFETFSDVSIKKTGAQAYFQRPAFEILLCSISIDRSPVRVLDMFIESDRIEFNSVIGPMLLQQGSILHAYNAAFEAGSISRHFGVTIDREYASKFRCSMLHGLYAGYTSGLDAVGKALGLPEDKSKLATGKALIKYFCEPCKPTKANGYRTRNYPWHDPEKWELFKEYCRQDTVTEMEVEDRLAAFPVPDFVQRQWETDLVINSRGVAVDMDLVQGALELDAADHERLIERATRITGLSNPNSVQQMSQWITARTGIVVDTLDKASVGSLLDMDLPPDVTEALRIRKELGKTSTKKYDAIQTCVCPDGRVRGLLQFYGANRTGRWAGRLVQVQNLPRTYIEPLPLARDLVKSRSGDALKVVYGPQLSDTLSQLIRTAFVAPEGHVMIDADFSAIEARVISWLAGEEWRLQVFREGGDIYCASASQMFHCNVVKGGENGHLRQKGKVAELALGYQGGANALIAMGALNMGLSEEELPDIVQRWREANSKIRNLWYDMDAAAMKVISEGGCVRVRNLFVAREYDATQGVSVLSITLPSTRRLYYVDPQITTNRFGNPSISYMGMDQQTKKWRRVETYGGKLTENCVQAIARDCLAIALENLEAAGLPVVFHVHDECVIDVAPFGTDEEMLETVVHAMTQPIPWAAGLPLDADGWVGTFFKKD